MGLTSGAMGIKTLDSELKIHKESEEDIVVALAGNPNVGKSTVFNNLTGMNQHTGNWPGKTVVNAQGLCKNEDRTYVLVDIPGTYSLMAHSAEEEVARNFICFGQRDAVVVVCDATCLERNLNLVLQTLEITDKVVVCVNLLDEAKRKNIHIDLEKLSSRLGVPVVGTIARKKRSLEQLLKEVEHVVKKDQRIHVLKVTYPEVIEDAVAILEPVIQRKAEGKIDSRWLSLQLLERDSSLYPEIEKHLGADLFESREIIEAVELAEDLLNKNQITPDQRKDLVVSSLVSASEMICKEVVTSNHDIFSSREQKIDRIITSRWAGYPLMLALLLGVFWLTITGANYPSGLLADGLFWIQDRLTDLFQFLNAPDWLHGALVLGVYRVLAWVISVMLPPMAIFFPLFTLLEDAGYLPRVAYNLDKPFKRCNACGKQSLTMCMGFDNLQIIN